jgi:hypothetical protein
MLVEDWISLLSYKHLAVKTAYLAHFMQREIYFISEWTGGYLACKAIVIAV